MASSQPRGGLANHLLKNAGLIKNDEDAKMRDVTGRKKTQKKLGHRQRSVNIYKGAADQKMLASRISANVSNPLAIRASLRSASTRTGRGGSRQNKKSAVDVWREVVHTRYNGDAKFLNLERLVDDETLKKHDIIPPGKPGASPQVFQVIFKLASQLNPPVETISLGHNDLQTGTQIMSLAHYVPGVRNLSLQGNKFRSWRDLEHLGGKGRKLASLRELIFLDNPLRDQEMKAGRLEQYKSGMVRRFPTLEVLDMEAITKISFDDAPTIASTSKPDPFDAPGPSSFPYPMGPSFITGVDGTIISGFLARFLPLFDNQRSALAEVYDPNATFSYSAVTLIPPRARIQGWHTSSDMPNQRKLEWQPWLRNEAGGSRNLKHIGSVRTTSGHEMDRELRTLHTGPAAIVAAISRLPATRHEVTGAADKFCMDAWPIGQGAATMLLLCFHGEFAELPSNGIRSFDRTFILAPAPAGSTAAANNWDVTILSDQFTVRAYSNHEAWKPGPMKVNGQAPSKLSKQEALMQAKITYPEVQAQLQAIPEPQRSIVNSLCLRTGLNVKFALDCLQNNGWDPERAVANFEEVKPSLAQDAYL